MKKIIMILVAVIGFGISASAQFRGMPISICEENGDEKLILFAKGYTPPKGSAYKYKYDNVFELWSGGALFQSGTWEYRDFDKSIVLTITEGQLSGQKAQFELTNVKTDEYGFFLSAEFKRNSSTKIKYISCKKAK